MAIREWWIGRTETGFDKWLTSKHPDEKECRNAFICSDASEKCVEYIPVIDATGMPTKEEIRKYIRYVDDMAVFMANRFGNREPMPGAVETHEWLLKLAAE